MPVASDIIFDWIAKDGYSLSEAGWIRPQDRQFYFEITAEKNGHRHIARAGDREQAVVHFGVTPHHCCPRLALLLNVVFDETKALPF